MIRAITALAIITESLQKLWASDIKCPFCRERHWSLQSSHSALEKAQAFGFFTDSSPSQSSSPGGEQHSRYVSESWSHFPQHCSGAPRPPRYCQQAWSSLSDLKQLLHEGARGQLRRVQVCLVRRPQHSQLFIHPVFPRQMNHKSET